MKTLCAVYLFLFLAAGIATTAFSQQPRTSDGLLSLYDFHEGNGNIVHDVSGVENGLDLTIDDVSGVNWISSGGLEVVAPTVINSLAPATALNGSFPLVQELTLEAWIAPANTTQGGPARIMSLSIDGNPHGGNFMMGQDTDKYQVRLRTSLTNQYGMPGLLTPPGTVGTEQVHVVFTRSAAGVRRVYLDGELVSEDTMGGDFSTWEPACSLTLANEPPGDRSWLGTLYLAAVYARALSADEVLQNFLFGPRLIQVPVVRHVGTGGSDTEGDGSETNPYATIQHAIDLSVDGDEVWILPGTYMGEGNRDIDFLGKKILVKSRDEDPATCIVDCQGSAAEPHRGFFFGGLEDSTSVLRGLTIRNGFASAGGGGILLRQSGTYGYPSPLIEDCVVSGNQGGGLWVIRSCDLILRGCEFIGNEGPGAFWTDEDEIDAFIGYPYAEDCLFQGNGSGLEVHGWGNGGGSWFVDCRFLDNTGYGLYVGGVYGGTALERCMVRGNGGFGVRVEGPGEKAIEGVESAGSELSTIIVDSVIEANGQGGIWTETEMGSILRSYIRNNTGPGITGGLWAPWSIRDSEISGNTGAGVDLMFGIFEFHANRVHHNGSYGVKFHNGGDSLYISNNMIFRNGGNGLEIEGDVHHGLNLGSNTIAFNAGHGLVWGMTGPQDLQGNLIAFNDLNALDVVAGDLPLFSGSDLFGNAGGDWTGAISGQFPGSCNLHANPFFCDSQADDYKLRSDSPCLPENNLGCGLTGAAPMGCTFEGTYYVATTGSDLTGTGAEVEPFGTIQHAIDQAVDGNEVVILPGTYTGDGNRDIDFTGKKITVRSRDDDPTTCIVDCQGSEAEPHRGFYFGGVEDSDSVLRGVTIRNGYDADIGGGILVRQSETMDLPSPVIENCVATLNYAPKGAGLGVLLVCHPLIRGCSFVANSGPGSGWYGDDSGQDWIGSSGIRDCRFEENTVGLEISAQQMLGSGSTEGGVSISNCAFVNNAGHGLSMGHGFVGAYLDSCASRGNGGFGMFFLAWGAKAAADFTPGVLVASAVNSVVEDNQAGGLYVATEGGLIQGCEIRNNDGPGIQGEVIGPYSILQNRIHGNSGPGVQSTIHLLDLEENRIFENGMDGVRLEGGGYGLHAQGNIIFANGEDGFDLSGEFVGTVEAISNTVAYNAGNGSRWDISGNPDLAGNIFAFNDLEGVLIVAGDVPVFSETDIYGNLSGDWTGAISGQYPGNCNQNVDPLFCDAGAGEFSLWSDSPCLSANHENCGPVGALGQGCEAVPVILPVIQSVLDIAGDEGGQVRVLWRRCAHDVAGSATVITGYGLYRQQGGQKILGWDFLTDIPARQDEFYQFVAPTLCDSTISGGLCTSTFMVSAMTADPGVYFDSEPATGYSVDNLGPEPPANLVVTYGVEGNTLAWDAPRAGDLSHYLVFRTEGDLDPDPAAKPLGSVRERTWTDADMGGDTDPWGFRYWLAAVDSSGNRSRIVGHSMVAGAGGEGAALRTALHPNVPNPFNPYTTIAFDLGRTSRVDLAVYDVSGRVVKRLIVDGIFASGPHEVRWDGRDNAGLPASAGVYFYRMDVEGWAMTRRMMLIK